MVRRTCDIKHNMTSMKYSDSAAVILIFRSQEDHEKKQLHQMQPALLPPCLHLKQLVRLSRVFLHLT